MTRVNKQVYPE